MEKPDDTIFDDAAFHIGGDWPANLPHSQAYVHTGLYLAWLIGAGLCSPRFAEEHAGDIAAFDAGDISGPELFERAGGILSSHMLSAEGEAFTADYFDLEHGEYLRDYGDVLADIQVSAYHVPDTPESARRIGERIGQRYRLWREKQTD